MLLEINYILGFRKHPVNHKKIEKKLKCIFQIVKNKYLLDSVNQKIKRGNRKLVVPHKYIYKKLTAV